MKLTLLAFGVRRHLVTLALGALLSLGALSLLSGHSHAATITLDNSFDAGICSGSCPDTGFNYPYTVTSSPNRILFVYTFGDNSGVDTVTGVKYGGRSMKKIATTSNSTDNRVIDLWCLSNPRAGTNTTTISNSSGQTFAEIISYAGAAQTCNVNATTTVNSTDAISQTSTLTTTKNNDWAILFARANVSPPIAGTNATQRQNDSIYGMAIFDTNGPITPAQTYSMNYTAAANTPMDSIMVAFTPAAGSVITLDNSADAGICSGACPSGGFSYPYTVTSSANRILFVYAFGDNNGMDTVTGVTYGGKSMTEIATTSNSTDNRVISVWCLVAPKAGTNTTTINNSSGQTFGENISYAGAAQTCNVDATNTQETTGATSQTSTVTTTKDNDWAILFARSNVSPPIAGTNSTQRQNDSIYGMAMFDTNGPIHPTSTYSMNYTAAASTPMDSIMIAVAP
jgi:hypothetical protein